MEILAVSTVMFWSLSVTDLAGDCRLTKTVRTVSASLDSSPARPAATTGCPQPGRSVRGLRGRRQEINAGPAGSLTRTVSGLLTSSEALLSIRLCLVKRQT